MEKGTDYKRLKFYVWVGLVYLFLWWITDLGKHPDTFPQRALNNVWRLSYVLPLTFILFEFTIPFISLKRKNVLYNIIVAIPLFFIHLMLYSWGLHAWRLLGIGLHIWTPLVDFPSTEHAVTQQMSYSMMTLFFFGIIRHIYNYIKLKQATQQLRIESQQAELNYLKSQTNPHFLFNTLNNIYSLARDKSDLAPESILRLSKILRFMLYETSGAYIAIEDEVRIIDDYIALERLRYDETLRVNFHHDIEDMKQAVPPLLLIPLIENAFKHGVSETRNHPFVEIHLSLNNRKLTFEVKNSTGDFSGEPAVKENIGLSNLRRQLELLYKDFQLAVQQGRSEFTATLKINLASHV